MEQPRYNLALILLLDPKIYTRNIFRGSPQSFATDPQALEAAPVTESAGNGTSG